MLEDFTRIGRRLFSEHLVGGNFGNMSVRAEDGYFITKTGSYLDADPAQYVLMPLNGKVTPGASSEWKVHTAVYNASNHQAIVHAHPPYAVSLSLVLDSDIVTIDSEGKLLAPEIQVVEGPCGSQNLADVVAEGLKSAHIVIARGHGTFAAGCDIDQAYLYTSLAEHCCKVLYLTETYR